ncbi:MAG: RlmE family RNA methyltransferase [Candidatus Odinarchaeota archaeon]|nr:RlmE family RNA methyltransferase [Candidatus Odinarchaeota archaeon]
MPKEWIKSQKKDKYYRESKKAGFKSRAAFKLIQINKKFRILKQGYKVLDLCSAPGSWIQVVQASIENPEIIAVDIVRMKDLPDVTFIQGDITQEEILEKLKKLGIKFDVVLSDCAPKTTGIRSLDQARQAELVNSVIKIATTVLRPKGNLVAKIFEGNEIKEIKQELKKYFSKIYFYKPEASRKHSMETYVIAKGFAEAV